MKISKRELYMELDDEEIVALIQERANDLGSHFVGYKVEIEEIEPDGYPGEDIQDGYAILKIIAQTDVKDAILGNPLSQKSVLVERDNYCQSGLLHLYARAKRLVALLEESAPAVPVNFCFPRDMFSFPDGEKLSGVTWEDEVVSLSHVVAIYGVKNTCCEAGSETHIILYNKKRITQEDAIALANAGADSPYVLCISEQHMNGLFLNKPMS